MSANSSNFRVNTFLSGSQEKPDIAIGPLGDFIIAWQSENQDGDGAGIFAQAYNASARPVNSEIRVNTTTNSDQFDPAVATANNGNSVIAWVGNQDGFSGEDIYAQRLNSLGQPIAAEFRVNISTSQDQRSPDVALDASGNFVVVYESEAQDNNTFGRDGDGTGIFGQRFDVNGTLVGPEFRINTYTEDDQATPVVAANSKGDFVVAWVSYGEDGSGAGIFGQRYNNSGVAVGAEFQINTEANGAQINPAIDIDDNGNFVVAWQSDDGDGDGIYARRYYANGNLAGSEFRVNQTTDKNQITPAVALDANGNFLIAWASEDQDGDGFGIFGQRFSSNGKRSGSEFQINDRENNDQTEPAIGLTPTGFIAAWLDQADSDNQNIVAGTSAVKNDIKGTNANDILNGGKKDDRIRGLKGDDTLRGRNGSDVLEGQSGSDRLEGGNSNDILIGGTNDDSLDGGQGNDTLTGDKGSDTFVLRKKQGSTLITDFEDGTDRLGLSAGIDFKDLRIEQQGGNTVVRLDNQELATLLNTTASNITYPADYVKASRSGRQIKGTNQKDKLVGGGGGDEITGLKGSDKLSGQAGDDELYGGDGDDRLFGEADDDYLSGNNGNDQLDGGDGDDYLVAGNGDDYLTGGAGKDIFFLQLKNGTTRIKDFQDGLDLFDLDEGLAASSVQVTSSGANTVLSINGQQLAILKNVNPLQITTSPSDFLL